MAVSLETSFVIPGYRFAEQIYIGSKTIVYRAIRSADETPVIIKLMRKENPNLNEIAQFHNQYTITKNLDIPGIIKPLNIENYGDHYAIVLEDMGGISLSEWRRQNGISLEEFFSIAIKIVTILEKIHKARIIHKDIKPANILINPETQEIRIIDFSIASLLPREIQLLKNPNVLEGTLAYISPEQTGRMNRGVDYRSDFYSLGVTFFELLTGELPFSSKDPMELVYCHIAKIPPRLGHKIEIPQALADIVMKLMAKNAEDRYQSAYGLIHDLEICQQQWQTTKQITQFNLATKDIADCFLIPEKLYGRQTAVENLLAAFERVTQGKTELVLVAGASGVGKTAVVNEVHKPIVRQRSYFIQGKFEQLQRDIPLFAFVQAFKDLIGQILSESDAQIQTWKTQILSALGEQAQVIIDLIPDLELILGEQPAVTVLAGSAAEHRLNLLLQRFIQVFTANERPLVLFLDDLQWADAASLKLLQLLMSPSESTLKVSESHLSENSHSGLLLIGTYRDYEIIPGHPLELTINEMLKSGDSLQIMTLATLTFGDLTHLVTDTLHCPENLAIPLTQVIFATTQGNPFFTHQFLKYLYQENIIEFNHHLEYWHCDISKVEALQLTDDVVEFMKIQLLKLPQSTQKALQLAACIGHHFDLKTLAIVYEKSLAETISDLRAARLEGMILLQSEVYQLLEVNTEPQYQLVNSEQDESTNSRYQSSQCQFVHDRIQQAAYSLIPEQQKLSLHFKIGKLLLDHTPTSKLEDNIFGIVNQLNMAIQLIVEPSERIQLAEMNLQAGRKALISTAYPSARKYLNTGIQLLPNQRWDTDYHLTLALYETATETSYLAGDFEQMEALAQVVLSNAKTKIDQLKIYDVKIRNYSSQGKALEAIEMALDFCQVLGVKFPENPSQLDVQKEIQKIYSNLAHRCIEDLIDLPEMQDVEALALMRVLASAFSSFYQAFPALMPLVCLKQIDLSLQFGNSPLSAFAYAIYGFMLCGVVGDIASGYQFGKLAVNLAHKCNNKEVKAKSMGTFNSHISHWQIHLRDTLKHFLETYTVALETGDLEFAAFSLQNYGYSAFFLGKELVCLQPELAKYSSAIKQINQEKVFYWQEIYHQTVLNLLENRENSSDLLGEVYDEVKMLPIHLKDNDGIAILHLYLCKTYLCYLFQDYSKAWENTKKMAEFLHGGVGTLSYTQFHFYDSLVRLAVYIDVSASEQQEILAQVKVNQEKLQHWASYAPMNYLHKFHLVEAEYHRVLDNKTAAMDNYERAINLAKENDYIHEAALACELAAQFYLAWGKQRIVPNYLTDAYRAYQRWGAVAKVKHLQKRYPQLLAPIIQQEMLKTHVVSKREPITVSMLTSLSATKTSETVISSHTSVSEMLDLGSVIKASQLLSGEIELEQLLSTLMAVVMENAGASKAVLMLSESETDFQVTSVSSSAESGNILTDFPSINLEDSQDIPLTLINYVKRTKEIFVSDHAKTVAFLAGDRYIQNQRPQSLVCIPIINQGKLLGMMYLENNLSIGAFTRDRIEVLKLITTQAAISLENAILYENLATANQRLEEQNHTLEQKVAQRTQELEEKNQYLQQTLLELQRTQTQLVQSEKMSSLGQMVAGIAHEINNPINFIHGNINHAHDYVQDLLDLVDIYQQEYPQPSDVIAEKSQEIDINFLVQDLPKVLESMKIGSSRIRNIVIGLRNFSRLDESEMKPVDIHEGIESTLMILQHRLKEKSDAPEILVTKDYTQLPLVNCYAGQLNQVFMNIISNAIDALEDSRLPVTEKVENLQINIKTELLASNTVRVSITDNGSGMTETTKQKIFDPFFTTKPIGSGTGLGLSISYQVVVEKHKGQLTCNSILGQGTEFLIDIPIQ
ncbi:trifunctional serine/threonine-protein kinase/ATP-binding protein/sensor histidine kinase [Nostoc sp. CMAA1605]|uniref:trifunctional serine/threonine-protein kinase/ATP-binding protein/sensor histidine kinase n=1 Tax=Nostoc sp. CMAA1605 TaxID=2055159 RepID=UPI001F3F0D70|nr:ATP-binding sensor histidine kinase [Nostoc sp. CMAA1605]MCF4967265.1 serine/threonine protein kinase [Nostoc sp. CMAA1605]